MLWQHYYQPSSLDEALQLLQQHASKARIVAGGTDVLVELQRGVKPTTTLIDITRLHELKYVRHAGEMIQLGGLATHNDVIASDACVQYALPLAQACWEVGAPQIRTRATIAGNLITASPANDSITPLMALGAEVVLISAAGERTMPLHDFYTGFRKTAIQPNELLREIRLPALQGFQRGLFIKLSAPRPGDLGDRSGDCANVRARTKSREPRTICREPGARCSVLGSTGRRGPHHPRLSCANDRTRALGRGVSARQTSHAGSMRRGRALGLRRCQPNRRRARLGWLPADYAGEPDRRRAATNRRWPRARRLARATCTFRDERRKTKDRRRKHS